MQSCLDGGTAANTVPGTPITINTSGVYTLITRAVDAAGNASPWRAETVSVDLSAPSDVTDSGTVNWTPDHPQVTVSAVDPVSGVDHIEWQLDGGAIHSDVNDTDVHDPRRRLAHPPHPRRRRRRQRLRVARPHGEGRHRRPDRRDRRARRLAARRPRHHRHRLGRPLRRRLGHLRPRRHRPDRPGDLDHGHRQRRRRPRAHHLRHRRARAARARRRRSRSRSTARRRSTPPRRPIRAGAAPTTRSCSTAPTPAPACAGSSGASTAVPSRAAPRRCRRPSPATAPTSSRRARSTSPATPPAGAARTSRSTRSHRSTRPPTPPAAVPVGYSVTVTGTDVGSDIEHVEWLVDGETTTAHRRGSHRRRVQRRGAAHAQDARRRRGRQRERLADRHVHGRQVAQQRRDAADRHQHRRHRPAGSTTPYTFTVKATDAVGVDFVQLRRDGNPIETFTGDTKVISFDTEGVHDIDTSATDVAGNASPWRSQVVKIDLTVPTDTTTIPTGWSNTPEFTLSGTDALSGIAAIQYRINGGSIQSGANGDTVTLGGDGTYTIETRALDRAGQLSAWTTRTLKVDRVLPVNTTVAPGTGWLSDPLSARPHRHRHRGLRHRQDAVAARRRRDHRRRPRDRRHRRHAHARDARGRHRRQPVRLAHRHRQARPHRAGRSRRPRRPPAGSTPRTAPPWPATTARAPASRRPWSPSMAIPRRRTCRSPTTASTRSRPRSPTTSGTSRPAPTR